MVFSRRWSYFRNVPRGAIMACPRCNRVRIERDGDDFRCAICGMPYDPNLGSDDAAAKESLPVPDWFPRNFGISQ